MIYVRIELWPGGDEKRKSLLGEARIANRSGGGPRGTYLYELRGKAGHLIKVGTFGNFPRKRLLGWDLLRWVLNHARADQDNIVLLAEAKP